MILSKGGSTCANLYPPGELTPPAFVSAAAAPGLPLSEEDRGLSNGSISTIEREGEIAD